MKDQELWISTAIGNAACVVVTFNVRQMREDRESCNGYRMPLSHPGPVADERPRQHRWSGHRSYLQLAKNINFINGHTVSRPNRERNVASHFNASLLLRNRILLQRSGLVKTST